MSSEKPKTGMKHPHSESHVPKERQPKKKHVLRNVALGLAALAGGAAAGCAPSARAQETTPRPRIEMVQSSDARVAPATAPSPPRPSETRLAQATTASASTSGYGETSVGSRGYHPIPEERVYEADPSGESPEVISGDVFRTDYGYTFQNAGATVMTLPSSGSLTMGEWEIEVGYTIGRSTDIKVKNRSLDYEKITSLAVGSKIILLPFPETEYARGPMLISVEGRSAIAYFFNKVSNCVTAHLTSFGNTSGMPEVGTEIYENKPYLYIAPPGSLTSGGDMVPGTRFYMYVLLTNVKDGDGPGAATGYFQRGND